MANPEHLAILKQGIEEWNRWRNVHFEVRPDLGMTNLRGSNLSEANLRMTDLGGSNLSEANLSLANLSGAHLGFADLRGADLTSARLSRTRLSGADLSGARVWGTYFTDLDLSDARGLEAIEHVGPSTVGIDTIFKSHGKIPDVFLRGCGVPDEFIAYIGSMVGGPIEYYSCFISYSSLDQEFAERLHADLQAKGVRCWFAPHDIHGGRKIHEQIDEAIRLHDKLLLILSEHSMASAWVNEEIARARKREAQERRQMLFPVALVKYDPVIREWECFDADRGKDSARDIREYYIPDFSEWARDHGAYQRALGKLVGDLKAVGSG